MEKTFAMISLGCAKNLVNSEQMLYLLSEAGYTLVPEADGADLAVVNTCGFIDAAKSEAIDNILEMAELKKEGRLGGLIVTGCLSERYKDSILSELPEIDAVLGVGSFGDIVEAADAVMAGDHLSRFASNSAPVDEIARVVSTGPSWAYLRIAEGCDNFCAFCAIPYIRGRYRSRPMENILEEARELAAHGVKELIVIAQDITRYGTDLYGSRGTGSEIRALFRTLRERIPGLVLRTSLIAGLPGEGEAEFEELCAFLKEARIERAGVFPFSPEEGTPAARMEHVDAEEAQRRADLILQLQAEIMDAFCESFVGKTIRVLCQSFDEDSGLLVGRSYADSPDIDGLVFFEGSCPPGEMADVRIDEADDGYLYGTQIGGIGSC